MIAKNVGSIPAAGDVTEADRALLARRGPPSPRSAT